MSEPALITHSNLLHVIKERAGERKKRAEQKRLEDLKLIESLNNKNLEGRLPLSILPKEMWDQILSYLVEPKDLQNASSTCPLFKELLEKRGLYDILFASVMEVEAFQDNCDFLFNDLKTADVIRRVCKSWRNAIDRWLKNGLVKNALSANSLETTFLRPLPEVWFDCPSKQNDNQEVLQDLLARFNPENPCGAKRFLSGSLNVFLWELKRKRNDFQKHFLPFKDSITEVLKRIGDQLWDFELFIQSTDNLVKNGLSMCEIYNLLVEWATLLPNLQSLSLCMGDLTSTNYSTLDEFIKVNPFPHLRKLELLKLTTVRGTAAFFEAIIRSNMQISKLVVTGNFPEGNDSLFELIHDLKLSSCKIISERGKPCRVEDIRHLTSADWPLKKIDLELEDQNLSMPNLFRTLNNFKTLEMIKLDMNCVMLVGEDNKGLSFLHLPNLIEFEFYYYIHLTRRNTTEADKAKKLNDPNYANSIDYLIESKKLEKLSWIHGSLAWIDFSINEERNELVQFQAGSVDFTRSNIWGVFPFLKSVEVHHALPRENGCNRSTVETIMRPKGIYYMK